MAVVFPKRGRNAFERLVEQLRLPGVFGGRKREQRDIQIKRPKRWVVNGRAKNLRQFGERALMLWQAGRQRAGSCKNRGGLNARWTFFRNPKELMGHRTRPLAGGYHHNF